MQRPALLAGANLISQRLFPHYPQCLCNIWPVSGLGVLRGAAVAASCQSELLAVGLRRPRLSFCPLKVGREAGSRPQRSLGTMLKCRTVWKKLAPLARHSSSACRQNVRTGEEEVDARRANLPVYLSDDLALNLPRNADPWCLHNRGRLTNMVRYNMRS